jgi:hypothetical protein
LVKHIHIGYGDSATGCILEAIKKHCLPGFGAVPSRDDFTQGPISECIDQKGIEQRISYWQSVEKVLGFDKDIREFYQKSIQLLNEVKADQITIWVGDSCHDILVTGWLLSFLEKKKIQWFIVDLADVEIEDTPAGSPVVNLAMYTPHLLSTLWKYRRSLTVKDKTHYISTFQKASTENSYYRIKEKSRIVSVSEDYYDEYILSYISDEFEPISKVIGKILQDGKHSISDTTVEWNIRKMIGSKDVTYIGNLEPRNGYSIRRI